MSRKMNIDTTNWGPFDETNQRDVMCERERHAFTQYMLSRLRKSVKTRSDETAIWIGALMSVVQMVYAQHDNNPPDTAREGLHNALDFGWLQCAMMAGEKGDLQ